MMQRKLENTVKHIVICSFLVHEHGIIQFINVYKRYMKSCCAELRWGDEVSICFFFLLVVGMQYYSF